MVLKTVQWNIGGGKIREEKSDAIAAESYKIDGIKYIIDKLWELSPQIITLQETHANKTTVQAKMISEALGFPFYFNDDYDDSHLEEWQRLGQAVISRFPISNHSFELFLNPKYRMKRPDGNIWVSHDKGVSKCTVDIGLPLSVETLHMVPFRKFEIDVKKDATEVIRDVSNKLKNDAPYVLIQGDFNISGDSLTKFLPELFQDNLQEVVLAKPTTPKGRNYDRVLFKGLRLIKTTVVDSVLTDHYPVYAEFEI
jgi:endonuclease/exonuclease/phosphatase family metal-dependent hydrolase